MSKQFKIKVQDSDIVAISQLMQDVMPEDIYLHVDRIANCQAHLIKEELLVGLSASKGRKLEFIAGRNSLRSSVRAIYDRPFIIGRKINGAPALPSKVVGSLTHKFPLVASICASIDNYAAIGIDLEFCDKWNPKVISTFITECDLSINSRLGLDSDELYSLLFCVKESAFKAFSSLEHEASPHILHLAPQMEQERHNTFKFTIKWGETICYGVALKQSPWIACFAFVKKICLII